MFIQLRSISCDVDGGRKTPMKSSLLKSAVLAGTVAVLAIPTVAESHAVWFAQRAKTRLALIFGDGSEESDSVARQKLITGVAGYDSDYRPVKAALHVAGPLLLFESEKPTVVQTAAVDYGVWSKTPDGEWQSGGKDQYRNAKISEHNFKYGVRLSAPLTKPLPQFRDQVIQVVPVTTIPQAMGRPLKVRVFFKGKPLAGALVTPDEPTDPDNVGVKTATDGTATIKVRNQGLNVVVATYNAPSDQPGKYDQMEYKATLSFDLPHAPE
jgi:nickel transport protein